MAKLIKSTGETLEVYPVNGKYFKLEEYYKLLNCRLIEIISISNGRLMVCDEEAKLCEDWDLNLAATELFREGRMSHHEYRDYMKKLCEKQNIAFIDASADSLDCIAGDVLVGDSLEIQ